jgi:hypothetical protein
MLGKGGETLTDERDFEMGQHGMRWYGWGSPIGLGSFAVLLSTAFALVRLAFR